MPWEERFWSRVDKTATCWLWTPRPNGRGYGYFFVSPERRGVRVHRLAYELLVGEIPEGLELDHLCSNKNCVRPKHLEPVTHLENLRRWGATITSCPRGHAYDGINNGVDKRGKRWCKICDKARKRRSHS